MVVARKTPVAPAPPASRSTSSQSLPRAIKQKSPPNAPLTLPPQKPRVKPKRLTKPQHNHQPSSVRRLVFVLLSFFSIYALTVCRTDYTLASPVCRSLDAYRTHILNPYVLPPIRTYLVPPIKSALTHPAVRAKVAPLQPYIHKAALFEQHSLRPRAVALYTASKARWDNLVVPAYKTYIVDRLWLRTIHPAYTRHIHPYVRPYIATVSASWHKHGRPVYAAASRALRTAYIRSHIAYLHAKPHAAHIFTVSRAYATTAYITVKPHVLRLYAEAKPHLAAFAQYTKLHASQALRRIGDARREFVDPHVRRIWDKVAEASRSEKTSPSPRVTTKVSPTLSEAASSSVVPMSSSVEEPIPAPASASSVIIASARGAAQSGIAGDLVSSVEESMSAPSSSPVVTKETPSPTPANSPLPKSQSQSLSASSILSASSGIPAHPVGGAVPKQEQEQEQEQVAKKEEEEDIDAFLRQIGLQDDASAPEPEPQPESEPEPETPPPPSEAELKAAVAARRADIVARHTRWQAELDEAVRVGEGELRAALGQVRAAAVWTLEGGGGGGGGRGMAEEVLQDVETEAERLLKGLVGYLHKVKGKVGISAQTGAAGTEEERENERAKEQTKWGDVVDRVEAKFAKKVREVQEAVHVWYVEMREKEIQEVLQASAKVKAIADKGQADLGLDYAWLDDVTYLDWQRYHDLMRTAENYTAALRSIQNGTHAAPAPDALLHALDALDHELEDLAMGFDVGVKRLVREAGREVFGGGWDGHDEHESGGDQEEGDDKVAEPEVDGEGKEPKASILPVSGVPQEVLGEEEMEHLFVGRGREEVLQALGREREREGAQAGGHVEL